MAYSNKRVIVTGASSGAFQMQKNLKKRDKKSYIPSNIAPMMGD